MRSRFVAVSASVAFFLPLPAHAEVENALLYVIVHPDNPARHLDRNELTAIFTASLRFWPHGTKIAPFNASIGSATRTRFDATVLGMSPRQVGAFWVHQKVRGGPRPPRRVAASAVLVSIVQRLPAAVAYVPADTCLVGVRVVAVIDREAVRAARPGELEERSCRRAP